MAEEKEFLSGLNSALCIVGLWHCCTNDRLNVMVEVVEVEEAVEAVEAVEAGGVTWPGRK